MLWGAGGPRKGSLMGMSTTVIGIRASTPEHKRMVAAWRANEAAQLDQPDKLRKYFDDEPPDAKGSLLVEIPKEALKTYEDDSRAGFDVDLSKIPAGVTSLRFYNSW